MKQGAERISLTAHYTGYVWKKNNFTEFDLTTSKGWWLYQLGRPFNRVIENFLVRRHGAIDQILRKEIESGRVTQVLELAAGLSPRGEKFMSDYGDSHGLTYIESDLQDQIQTKVALLKRAGGATHARHHFVAIDAFQENTKQSLEGATSEILDPKRGLAIITEGLISYFETKKIEGLFGRLARFGHKFVNAAYICDFHLTDEQPMTALTKLVRRGIETCARTKLHLHYRNEAEARVPLLHSGFKNVEFCRASGLEALGKNSRPMADPLRIAIARV